MSPHSSHSRAAVKTSVDKTPFALGAIRYINVLPLYYHLPAVWADQAGGEPFPLSVVQEVPSHLNRMLAEGKLSVSPISSIEIARHPQDYLVVDGLSIHSVGPVQSVLLVSKVPIEKLDGKKIGMTSDSETSRVLLHVLLSQSVGVKAKLRELASADPLADNDAALLIGDPALKFGVQSGIHRYDLGELWHQNTGAPMVFAVWAARRDEVARDGPRIRAVVNALHRSLEWARGNMGPIIREAARQTGLTERDAAAYFRHLRYDLDGVAINGLRLFFECAARAREISDRVEFDFLGR
ncbi:MAG: menaquinone biosynthetic enzyme MqnA/MqnD family protein [Candidatus Xenobia bacterium]